MNIRAVMAVLLLLAGLPLQAAEGKVLKVLTFYLDAQGRHALSPSLFERDAYQVRLRQNPELRKGLRVDVDFKTTSTSTNLQLRIELRCNRAGQPVETTRVAPAAKTGFTGHWQSVKIEGAAFEKLGSLLAWRVTLRDGDRTLGEQKSFLW